MITRRTVAVISIAFAAPCAADVLTRTSGFDYEPTTTFMTREVLEPANSNLCLVTAYTPDAFGNRASTTVRNCNGQAGGFLSEAASPTGGDPLFPQRASNATYGAGSILIGGITYLWNAGQFATLIVNALGQQETRTYDPRFGAVATLVGPNHLQTSWTYDNFGRKSSESRPDSTATSWFYELCSALPAGTCPPSLQGSYTGEYRVRVTATGNPTTSTYYDTLNREIRTETQGFDGTLVRKDTQYDNRGRAARVSRPYYAGAAPAWTVFAYDSLGRVITQTDPNTAVTTTTYSDLVTTVTNALNQVEVRTKNSQGQVIQVNRH